MSSTHDSLYKLIGDRIKMKREQLRPVLSQARLAEMVRLSRASLVNIEAGRQKAPVHVLWDICDAIGIEMTSLIPGKAELDGRGEPFHLTASQIDAIEKAVSDDPRTRRLVSQFVARMAKEGGEQ